MLMGVLDLKRFEQIEEIIGTVHKAFPHVPKSVRRFVTEIIPYVIFLIALIIGFATILPLFSGATDFILGEEDQIFKLNHYLLQAVLLLCSVVLIISFKPLSLWMKKGWYNLFYVSLIQLLLTLMFFNVYTFSAQIITWYVLFEIKTEYT